MMKLRIDELEEVVEMEFTISNEGARAVRDQLAEFLDFQTEKMIAADPKGDRTRAYAVLRGVMAKIDAHFRALKEAQKNAGADRANPTVVRELWRVRR